MSARPLVRNGKTLLPLGFGWPTEAELRWRVDAISAVLARVNLACNPPDKPKILLIAR